MSDKYYSLNFEEPEGLDLEKLGLTPEELRGPNQQEVPRPDFETMSVAELRKIALTDDTYANRAVFELLDRAASDDTAARAAGDLGKLPLFQNDRLHRVSVTWVIIERLLAAETPVSRESAYDTFAALGPDEQNEVLRWMRMDSITSPHPGT